MLPNEDDEPQNLARAIWLDKHQNKQQEIAIRNAIAKLFNQ
ncbi:DUF6890 family protein [Salinivibrio kushneri]